MSTGLHLIEENGIEVTGGGGGGTEWIEVRKKVPDRLKILQRESSSASHSPGGGVANEITSDKRCDPSDEDLVGSPIIKQPVGPHFSSVRRSGLGSCYSPTTSDNYNGRDNAAEPSRKPLYSEGLKLYRKEDWPSVSEDISTAATQHQESSWSAMVRKPVPLKISEHGHTDTQHTLPDDFTNNKKKKKVKKTAAVKREPLLLELDTIFQALEFKSSKKVVMGAAAGGIALNNKQHVQHQEHGGLVKVANALDSSAPTQRRGKEREEPRKKKPSALRRVIIKEKEERKTLGKSLEISPPHAVEDHTQSQTEEASSLLPSPGGGGGSSSSRVLQSNAGFSSASSLSKCKHNRMFREYCNHLVTKEINECVALLLTSLVSFQDRQYLKDPTKAKYKRRYTCGLREVLKHLKVHKLKCVIMPPNLDRIQSEGGINDYVSDILEACAEQRVPIVFAMTRRRLAYVLKKKQKIGCAGIFFYDGAETHFKKMMELVANATAEYRIVTQENPSVQTTCNSHTETNKTMMMDDSDDNSAMCSSEQVSNELQYFNSHTTEFTLNANAAEFTPTSLP